MLDWNGNGRIDPVDIGIFIAIQNQNDNQEETDTDLAGSSQTVSTMASEAFGDSVSCTLFPQALSNPKSKKLTINRTHLLIDFPAPLVIRDFCD